MAQEIFVSKNAGGQKLFNFLKRSTSAENNEIHRWIRTGQVRINKKRAKAFDLVKEGDIIRIPPFAELTANSQIQKIPQNHKLFQQATQSSITKTLHKSHSCPPSPKLPFPVIYENEELLVINKPQGIACQGGTGQKENIADILKSYYSHADFIPAPAHRLDKESQGLMLIGKSYQCLHFLTEYMKGDEKTLLADIKHPPKKIYHARVYGDIRAFSVNNPYLGTYLYHCEKQKKEQVSSDHSIQNATDICKLIAQYGTTRQYTTQNSKEPVKSLLALSTLKVIKSDGKTSLIEVGIYTGRKHQIRAQLAHFGFPLVGDKKYAPRELLQENNIFFLQSCKLTLPESPFTDKTVFQLN